MRAECKLSLPSDRLHPFASLTEEKRRTDTSLSFNRWEFPAGN